MLGLPKTANEYEHVVKFIKRFKIINCSWCKKDFTWRTRNNHPPVTCSKTCKKEWFKLKNRQRQQKFRANKKQVARLT